MKSAGKRSKFKNAQTKALMRLACHQEALLHLKRDDILPLEICYSEKGRGIKVYLRILRHD